MISKSKSIVIATRGSALALAQTQFVRDRIETLFPNLRFEVAIFKTTGDRLQKASFPSHLPKGLFTKELELALIEHRADLAVHSLKDLPTELPDGLILSGVSSREDVREVLLTRIPIDAKNSNNSKNSIDSKNSNDSNDHNELCDSDDSNDQNDLCDSDDHDDLIDSKNSKFEYENPLILLPDGARIGTGSSRREAFLKDANATFRAVEIRGNVPTRIEKLARSKDLDGIILAAAGLRRLGYELSHGRMICENDTSIFATFLPVRAMIPCVGQGAIALQTRRDDHHLKAICDAFTDVRTRQCVETERAFLASMGGGCQSPIAALATINQGSLSLITASATSNLKIIEAKTDLGNFATLANELAAQHKHFHKKQG